MANQMNAAQMAVQNAQLRGALIQTAPRMRKALGGASGALGGTTRVKLFNVGILTKLLLGVVANITIATANGVASSKAPYNLINNVRVTDYDGTDRVNLSGFQLYVLNSVRRKQPYGANNAANANTVLSNPVVPTAQATADLSFFLEVPIAYDIDNPIPQLQDLRGAILAQTSVGDLYLTVTWNSLMYANGNVEAVYSGGASTVITTNSITLSVWQDYLLPQAIGGGGPGAIPLPQIDLMTVYELAGNLRVTANLAQGQEGLLNFPNVRSVIGAYWNFINNGAMSNALGQIRTIANGNNILTDDSVNTQLLQQRLWTMGDLVTGAFYKMYREKPIETALYGNVQLGLTPNAALASPNVEVAWESFYTKGQALPGMVQGN